MSQAFITQRTARFSFAQITPVGRSAIATLLVSGKPAVERTLNTSPAEGIAAAVGVVFLSSSLKLEKISSENDANFTVASSNAAAAPTVFVFLVTPVKVVDVIPE